MNIAVRSTRIAHLHDERYAMPQLPAVRITWGFERVTDAHLRDREVALLPSCRKLGQCRPGNGRLDASEAGEIPTTLDFAKKKCLELAGINRRFTIHRCRCTFTDLTRLAKVDAVWMQ